MTPPRAAAAAAASEQEQPVAARIGARLDELARIGARPSGGVSRLAYGPEERAAHELFARWAADDGAAVEVDAAGNSVATFSPGSQYFLVGSHLDTVADGGRYDGAAGVVAGLEVARLLADQTSCGVRVVAFAGEEGARFGRPTLGSAAAAGTLPEAAGELRDAAGVSLVEAAGALALDPWAVAPWLGDDVMSFFEIHIEQGRQLEGGAARIGLVDAIAGSVRLRLDVLGRADHSGATPMEIRTDALAAASEIVLAIETAGRGYRSTVATVGRVEVTPNSVTTVAGAVRLWVDVRDVDPEIQRQTTALILDRAHEIVADRGARLDARVLSDLSPVVLAAWPRTLAAEECQRLRLPFRVLSSGAGHDAAIVARHAPAMLFFVPCVDGVSHSPEELASAADVAAATLLTAAVIRRADALVV